MQFHEFGAAVAKQFQQMTATGLFQTDIDKDALWAHYLASFPAGSNPVHKTRTEHDCTCCRHFIKTIGGVLTLSPDTLTPSSIWDIRLGGHYQVVADKMSEFVRRQPITNIFLHTERNIGTAKNFQQLLGEVKTWEHFHVSLPVSLVVDGERLGPKLSDAKSTHDVMLRGLNEITLDAIDTVLELIAQNTLYRGEEHQATVEKFRAQKVDFDKISRNLPGQVYAQFCDNFVWVRMRTVTQAVARIRNTSIGTLLTDLSSGMELENAVKAFETKVAPANYKRTTALVSKAMVKKAQAKIEELGLTSALERRYATIDDLTINNVLFADRLAQKAMNAFDELAAAAPVKTKSLDKVEEVSIEKFLQDILPKASSLEVLFENRHAPNLVGLVAPVDPTAKGLFKWSNNFSWAYAGEMADSIKERVKKAGGNVTGDLCCRLAWNYEDDLDFHMNEPDGNHIFYRCRRILSSNGGELDLDANGCDGIRSDPAENIVYADKRRMAEGVYTLSVNNYDRRSTGKGFEVEIEFDGHVHHIVYEKPLRMSETVQVAKIEYSRKFGFKILQSLPSNETSKTLWNLPTQTFHKAQVVLLSPNYWNGHPVGNKHYFFMLENCRNDGQARGFFNEFLAEDLMPHRKVLEMVGAKMKTEASERQLSGLGFSSTQRNSVLCRVKGNFTRTLKVTF